MVLRGSFLLCSIVTAGTVINTTSLLCYYMKRSPTEAAIKNTLGQLGFTLPSVINYMVLSMKLISKTVNSQMLPNQMFPNQC